MTYQDKYTELHSKCEKAGKELEIALNKLSETNGFGDLADIKNYSTAIENFKYSERQFSQLLKYMNHGEIDSSTEFISCEYMYGFIKNDLIEKGEEWQDYELYPGQDDSSRGYMCEIGLTNEKDIKKDYMSDQFRFPVLNLKHGKECYSYLSSKLQYNPKGNFNVEDLDFSSVIDESKPIFVKVAIRTK